MRHIPVNLSPATRLGFWCAIGLTLIAAAAWVRPHWMHAKALHEALSADTLDESDLSETSLATLSPAEAQQLWNTGRLGHRRALLTAWIARRHRSGTVLDEAWDRVGSDWLLDAAVDPDLELRTRALGAWQDLGSPAAVAAFGALLEDADPEVRRLALQTLRLRGSTNQVGWVLPRLRDTDPSVALAADAALRQWTGIDSGLRLSRVLPVPESLVPQTIAEPDRLAIAQAATEWQSRFPGAVSTSGIAAYPAQRLPTPGFILEDLQGRPVDISSLKGKRVLLNFWASWCPACLSEFPILNALQARHPTDLVILGISLDSPGGTGPATGPLDAAALRALRNTVGATAARHRLGFPVLLDPERRIGRRFNGGELPTQVLLDREGWIRRRFVGGRSLETWEALLLDAERPAASRAGGRESREPVADRPM